MDYQTISTRLTEAADLLGGKVAEDIGAVLALGEAVPIAMLEVQLKSIQPEIDEMEQRKSVQDKIDEKADELWDDYVKKFDDVSEEQIKKYFYTQNVKGERKYRLKDNANLKLAVSLLMKAREGIDEQAEAMVLPKKVRRRAGGADGVRRPKGSTEAWYKNTIEDGEAEYKVGMYACQTDIANKQTYEDNMKIYKVGEKDPRNPTEILANDLTKYQYKGVVREDPIQDEENQHRCRGAVAWKAGRMGCEYAKQKGFKGSVMAQCSEQLAVAGFCSKCEKKKIDYFDKNNKYKKANLPWCEAFGDELVEITATML